MKTLSYFFIKLLLVSIQTSHLHAQAGILDAIEESLAQAEPSPRIAEIRLEPKQISLAVEEFADAFENMGDGSEAHVMPTIIWEKASQIQMVQAPLRLVNVGPADGLALIAAAARCSLEPINSPLQNNEFQSRIIGYRISKITLPRLTVQVANVTAPDPRFLAAPSVMIPPSLAISSEPEILMIDNSGEVDRPKALVGIGVTLREEEGEIVIGSILPESPASKFEVIKPGVRIESVGPDPDKPIDLEGLRMLEAFALIRGKEYTPVTLWVRDPQSSEDDVIEVTLEREKLSAPETIPMPAPSPSPIPRGTVVNPLSPVPANSKPARLSFASLPNGHLCRQQLPDGSCLCGGGHPLGGGSRRSEGPNSSDRPTRAPAYGDEPDRGSQK
ncbi:MAG: hypothetical protein AAF585_14400 [Verrucomicrobiota bacterium]